MLRILHTLAQRPGRTGSGIFLISLIQQAAKLGHEQALITGIPKQEILNFPQIEEQYQYAVRFNTPELPFPVAGMSDLMPYSSTRYREMTNEMLQQWSKAFEDKLLQTASEFKPQAILTHHLWLLTGLVTKIFPDVPVIAICHGTGLRQLGLAPNLKEVVVKGCRKVDLVMALNSFQKEEIYHKYGIPRDKIIVTGCGYNGDIFFQRKGTSQSSEKTTLVYCGKLSMSKGVFQLLEVFKELTQTRQNIELIMIGSGQGEETAEIKKFASSIPAPITFTGALPQTAVGEIFRKSDIFVLPSFYEGFGLVVLEALASGLKVVTTDIPGLSNWLGDTVNCSGQISYVNLPRMRNMDQPYREDLAKFKRDLLIALQEMIDRNSTDIDQSCLHVIRSHSWEQLFQRIARELEKLIARG